MGGQLGGVAELLPFLGKSEAYTLGKGLEPPPPPSSGVVPGEPTFRETGGADPKKFSAKISIHIKGKMSPLYGIWKSLAHFEIFTRQ